MKKRIIYVGTLIDLAAIFECTTLKKVEWFLL